MARFVAALTVVLVSGCCQTPSAQTAIYFVDDAVADRILHGQNGEFSASACRDVCSALAGQVDGGPVNHVVSDGGAERPTLPAYYDCSIEPADASWRLTCSFRRPCSV